MFIGKNLEDIRLIKGLSRKNLADNINVSEQAIWQYEVKNMMPEINKIYDLSKEFNVKTSYFLTKRINGFNNVSVDKHAIAFRADNQNVSTKHLNKQFYQAIYLKNLTDYLYSFVKTPHMYILDLVDEVNAILKDSNSAKKQKEIIRKVAKKAREHILGNKANNDLLFTLEKSGIIIYEKKIDNDADAFSFWSEDDMPYIILGNNKGVAVRRNFDIAHELGHLLLHRHVQFDLLTNEEHKIIENEANVFASEFLLPELEFREDFSKITKKSNPDHFKLLKEKWYVSIQAMGMRAYYLKLISSSQYRYFWSSINKKDYRKLEPLDEQIKISHPVKINSLLDLLFRKKVITPQDLLEDLKVEPEFLKEIANIDYKLFERYFKKEKTDKKVSLMNDFLNLDK
ncbi:XRE family transcriptional regulator [Staphylococcus simulans]|uniref:spr1629 family repressor/antitoxin n=1 Tax=Staphylococcus simulans TaxID=1286 RepID=UPI000D02E844|nr:XRE family transcriptional regulator [Staphylococcus simulans]MCD8915408.1 XRE family transcriptional regulator [Staphylococcus simulans]